MNKVSTIRLDEPLNELWRYCGLFTPVKQREVLNIHTCNDLPQLTSLSEVVLGP